MPSFMKSKWNSAAVNRILIECIKKILPSYSFITTSRASSPFKHTCKEVGCSLFSLISNANLKKESRQLLNYSINLVHFPSYYSFFHVFLYLRGLYPNCPHTEKDGSSVGSGEEERATQNAKGIIKGAAQPAEAQVFKSFNRTDSAHNPHRKRVSAVPKEFHLKAKRKQGLVNAIVTEIAATYTQLFLLYNRNTLHLI